MDMAGRQRIPAGIGGQVDVEVALQHICDQFVAAAEADDLHVFKVNSGCCALVGVVSPQAAVDDNVGDRTHLGLDVLHPEFRPRAGQIG